MDFLPTGSTWSPERKPNRPTGSPDSIRRLLVSNRSFGMTFKGRLTVAASRPSVSQITTEGGGVAPLRLAQTFMLLLWLAMGVFPAGAQTGAALSGLVTDQAGAALPHFAVTRN